MAGLEESNNLVVSSAAGLPLSKESFISSITLAIVAISAVSFCLARRIVGAGRIRGLPLARWLIVFVFSDSWMFVFASTVLQSSFGLNSSSVSCDAGILLCLVCYLSSKVLIYMFLVEKVYVIGGKRSRWRDRTFLFNIIGMLVPYSLIIVLTFVFRNARIGDDGQCRIGLKLQANIPMLIFDVFANLYLTVLFLIPLRELWSFKSGMKSRQGRLRRIAFRTFVGCLATLSSTLANLIALLILRGKEPGWVCFAACNADILFSVLVLHWVTHQDETTFESTGRCGECHRTAAASPHYSTNHSGIVSPRNNRSQPGHFGGEIVTACEANNVQTSTKSIPSEGIMTKTEFIRDIESLGESSGSGLDANSRSNPIK